MLTLTGCVGMFQNAVKLTSNSILEIYTFKKYANLLA